MNWFVAMLTGAALGLVFFGGICRYRRQPREIIQNLNLFGWEPVRYKNFPDI